MMNSEQVAYQISEQVGVRLKGMNAVCHMFDNLVPDVETLALPHVDRKWGQIWPWEQLWGADWAVRGQAEDNWETLGGDRE